jgi:hypothetical protein
VGEVELLAMPNGVQRAIASHELWRGLGASQEIRRLASAPRGPSGSARSGLEARRRRFGGEIQPGNVVETRDPGVTQNAATGCIIPRQGAIEAPARKTDSAEEPGRGESADLARTSGDSHLFGFVHHACF